MKVGYTGTEIRDFARNEFNPVSSDRRKLPRIGLSLPVEVQSYACEAGTFLEQTETINLSPLGVSFLLRHLVVLDDILRLSMAMPHQLRLFDFDLPQYNIYAQVRRVRPRADGYNLVGVAFISKEAPDLELNQSTLDQIAAEEAEETTIPHPLVTRPISPDYKIPSAPLDTQASKPESTPSSALRHPTLAQKAALSTDRGEPRAKLRISLSIRGLDKNGLYFQEVIQTEDVSKHGLCFFITKREMDVNSIIEIVGFQGKFSAQGEVRHTSYNATDKTFRIGLRLLGEPSNWIVK